MTAAPAPTHEGQWRSDVTGYVVEAYKLELVGGILCMWGRILG